MAASEAGATSYSTGGGGTVLEHRYGAVLLAAMLTGDPITELGDDVAAQSVQFQASSISPVDDLVIESADGEVLRRVSIGVRRSPALTTKDSASVPLVASYLRVVVDHWPEVQSGNWRLALAVADANPAVRQLRSLTVIARSVLGSEEFRARTSRAGETTEQVRRRLVHLDALFLAAAEILQPAPELPARELVWRTLSALQVRELRLEGAEHPDRTDAVRSLRSVVADGSLTVADATFSRLAELVGSYAPAGALVSEARVRRDLVGHPLRRSPTHALAWTQIERLERRLRDWTRADLQDATTSFQLDRGAARSALAAEMSRANSDGPLVVTGEPDVGKSALALRAMDDLASEGAAVTVLSMRDLPATTRELEDRLGSPLADVLTSGAQGPVRLLLLDGAEVALQGRADLLKDMALTAMRAGLGVVAVTRTDGARRVVELIAAAARAAQGPPPRQHVVLPLSTVETDLLTEKLPALGRLGQQERSRWVLSRPGLVDLLLQSGVAPGPGEILSEADVFAAVWDGLVRRHEETAVGAPTPDQRDIAMVELARRELVGGGAAVPFDASTVPALRSSGLLKTDGLPAAWRAADEFASDLIRDFAVARLLITDGWDALGEANGPRWAVRAVRLACQVQLTRESDPAAVWDDLQTAFGPIAGAFGQRWAEIPLEALLTLGDARSALTEIWPRLTADDGDGARVLIRLALQRYVHSGIGEPAVLSSLVASASLEDQPLPTGRQWRRHGDTAQVGELVLAWLRGLLHARTGPLPARQRVRDAILATNPSASDEFVVEAIASLGPDLDSAAEEFLRGLMDPGFDLWPAVESVGAVLGIAVDHPTLLLDLVEAYYIEADIRPGWDYLDDGIRHHRAYDVTPQVAWWYGPFFRMLNQRPVETLTSINRMLDHAARIRVRPRPSHDGPLLGGGYQDPTEDLVGVEIGLPDLGERHFVGDAHVWAWYRGSSVGPYPCMSALLAVEKFADHLVDTLHLPLGEVVRLLLADCHNLAMPGLVIGLLGRHLENAGTLLDPWLAHPDIWHLEFSRTVNEGVLHVQGPDDVDLVGRDRRSWNLRDLVARMTVTAAGVEDHGRLAVLAVLSEELVARATAEIDELDDGAAEQLASVQGWAGSFRPENYYTVRTHDGLMLQYQHPEPVAAVLAPSLVDLAAGHEALRLHNTYAAVDDRTAPMDHITEDLVLARRLAESPPAAGPVFPQDSIAAVAAAAVVAQSRSLVTLPADDLLWAVDILLAAAVSPPTDLMGSMFSIYPRGADRSAAAALPRVLLPAFDLIGLNRDRISAGLRASATSDYDEVRAVFAVTAEEVWKIPCDSPDGTVCRHQQLWDAVQNGLADVRLGPWSTGQQRRSPVPLSPPYLLGVAETATEDLLVNRLVGPLVSAAQARSTACVGAEAEALLSGLLDAHRRGADHWAREGYGGYEHRDRELMARTLSILAIDGQPQPLTDHVRKFTTNANALQMLLRDLALVFTYDAALRPHLGAVWRHVMAAALDAVDAGADLMEQRHWVDWALAGLLPTPHLSMGDQAPDDTLRIARAGWVAPDVIADLATRWMELAKGEPRAADAVAQLAQCAPVSWQEEHGLKWTEHVVDGQYERFASRCWALPTWLAAVRESGLSTTDTTARWRRLVDGLAAAGDRRAAELQQLDE